MPTPLANPNRWITHDRKSLRQRILASALLIVVLGCLGVLRLKDPRTLGFGELCPSRRLLNLACPGCGSTRTTYDLLHGEFASALRMNPALVLVGVPLGTWWSATLLSTVVLGSAPRLRVAPRVGYGIAIALVAYFMLRNLPFESLKWLSPPPVSRERDTREPNHPIAVRGLPKWQTPAAFRGVTETLLSLAETGSPDTLS